MSEAIQLSKIETLTPEQEKAMYKYRDEWLAIGRSTEPADRETAERVFGEMYKALGREAPYVWWCDGPAVAALVRAIVTNQDQRLRDNLWANLGDNLWDNLWANLGANLGDNLRANLRDNLWDNLWDNLHFGFWGAHESYWPAYFNWPDEALRRIYSKEDRLRLSYWLDLCRSMGWWEPYEGVVFACERPSLYKFDDRGLLHCEDGPAIVCRDGWEVHCWHGINIPNDWVSGEKKLDAATAITWSNMEQRRAACEIVGWRNVLDQLNAKTIDKGATPFVGDLLEVEIPDIGREKFLRVRCGTQREFALPVPPEMKRASQAQAWLNFTTEDMYLPQVRT